MTAKAGKLCFVVGPIGIEDSETRIHADWLLEMIIQPVMEGFPEYQVKRADQDQRPGLIDAQLINDLLTADLVIADLSTLNPNAFYEIGIRHMAQKPIIHMQLAHENIPFDLSLYRAIKFSRLKPRDLKDAKDKLLAQVRAVEADGYQVENPVTNARGRFKLESHATPEQQLVMNQLRSIQERLEILEGEPVPMTVKDSPFVRSAGGSSFNVGDMVRHQKYGDAQILEIDGNKITVRISTGESKRIVDSFLELLPRMRR